MPNSLSALNPSIVFLGPVTLWTFPQTTKGDTTVKLREEKLDPIDQ